MGLIYLIQNTVNKKCYVGQTTRSITKRYKQHMSKGSTCTLLKKSIEKYGKDKFTCTVLLECDNKDLPEYEKKYIEEYRAFVDDGGLNLTRGGEIGKEYSEELKQKLRERSRQAWKDGKFNNNKISDTVLQQRKQNATGGVYHRKDCNRYVVTVPYSWICEESRNTHVLNKDGVFLQSFKSKQDAEELLKQCRSKVSSGRNQIFY